MGSPNHAQCNVTQTIQELRKLGSPRRPREVPTFNARLHDILKRSRLRTLRPFANARTTHPKKSKPKKPAPSPSSTDSDRSGYSSGSGSGDSGGEDEGTRDYPQPHERPSSVARQTKVKKARNTVRFSPLPSEWPKHARKETGSHAWSQPSPPRPKAKKAIKSSAVPPFAAYGSAPPPPQSVGAKKASSGATPLFAAYGSAPPPSISVGLKKASSSATPPYGSVPPPPQSVGAKKAPPPVAHNTVDEEFSDTGDEAEYLGF